jgi:hypothetical protein
MKRLFDRQPGYDAALFAEAQALIDDGLDAEFVLALYPADAEWLTPLLETTGAIIDATRGEQPSYFFEASLKQRFLVAAREQQTRPAPAPVPLFGSAPSNGSLRTAFAGTAVAAAAAVVGVVTLGFVTAGQAVPGDWNYTFKLAHERLDYSLSSGGHRVDIQLGQTEARVQEIIQLSRGGTVSTGDLQKLEAEASQLADLARTNGLDDLQKARLRSIGEASVKVLTDVSQKQQDLNPAVESAITSVTEAVSAGLGGVKPAITPKEEPAATPTATESPSATADPAATTATAQPAN